MITKSSALHDGVIKTTLEKVFKSLFQRERAKMNEGKAELASVAGYLQADTLVIDIGANIGSFSRRFIDLCPGCTVLAFEPQSMARNIFAIVRLFKRKGRIITLPLALSDTTGLAELSIPVKRRKTVGIGLAHIGDDTDLKSRFDVKKEVVPVARLDDVLKHYDLGPVCLIKIDVEGGELNVLRGAVDTLRHHKPALVCEIDDRQHRFSNTESDLLLFLKDLGYGPFDLETATPITGALTDTNILFLHNSKTAS